MTEAKRYLTTLAAGHEPGTQRLIYGYLVSASIWLVVGTAYGLLAAIKLYWPEAAAYDYLSFGRIRPIHTNIAMFGWSSMALMGLALYVVTRTSKVPLYKPQFAWYGMHLWNLAMVLAVITLSLGLSRSTQEYREMLWPVMLIYAIGLICNFYTACQTLARRAVPEIYVSNWYMLGAMCWVAIIIIIGYLPFYQHGMGNIVIGGYYMHNAVGMWFTPMVLGITYYALPRMLGKPITDGWKALGEQIYGNNCSSCHQATGTGLPNVFPTLKGDPVVLVNDPADHIKIVLNVFPVK
jgi:cytochrome c oxidase cbb3-type subunit 1